LTGNEIISIAGLAGASTVPREIVVQADDLTFRAKVRIDTPTEESYYLHGGVLLYVLRQLLAAS
jgi:aconitate hydratase